MMIGEIHNLVLMERSCYKSKSVNKLSLRLRDFAHKMRITKKVVDKGDGFEVVVRESR